MSESRLFRVAMAGAGAISRNHLLAWDKLENAKVVCLCDPNIERARGLGAEFGIEAVYPDLSTMLAAHELDAVDIATPRETHAGLVLECVAHGLPVLCQKPFAPTYGQAKDLIEAIDGRVRVMVHENWRFRTFYRRISRLLREGVLGEIKQCSISVRRSGLLPAPDGTIPALKRQPMMRTEPRLMIAETLIHHIDVVRWLLGSLELRGAVASSGSPHVIGEETATLLFSAAGNLPVIVSGSNCVAGFDPRAGDHFELLGTRNSLSYANGLLTVWGNDNFTEAFDEDIAYQASFDGAIAHFIHALSRDEPFETNPEDNLNVLRLVEDAYEYLQAGRRDSDV